MFTQSWPGRNVTPLGLGMLRKSQEDGYQQQAHVIAFVIVIDTIVAFIVQLPRQLYVVPVLQYPRRRGSVMPSNVFACIYIMARWDTAQAKNIREHMYKVSPTP